MEEPTETLTDGVASVTYRLGGAWLATFAAQVAQPWDGPETLTIRPDLGGDDDEVGATIAALDATKGIGTDVLTALPLADARMRLRRLRGKAQVPAEDVEALRSRERGPVALARFAAIYARCVQETPHPLVALSAASGVSSSALSQRALRARKAGYLTSPTDDSLGELTTSAERLLRRVHEQWAIAAHKTNETERKN